METDRQTGAGTSLHGKHKNYPRCDPEHGIQQGCKERYIYIETQKQTENGMHGVQPQRGSKRGKERQTNREAKACMASEVL